MRASPNATAPWSTTRTAARHAYPFWHREAPLRPASGPPWPARGVSDTAPLESINGPHQGRAANFALAFAVHRLDPDAAVIHQAALLHDFAELLLWCHAPDLALEIQDAQRMDSTLRSKVVQKHVLNIDLEELQHALMQDWYLPEFLVHISDTRHAHHPNVQCVSLGVRVARHTSLGWDNAAVPDDVADVAQLLNLSTSAAMSLLRSLDI